MKQITINLLTKKEAELYCKRMYPETKVMPVTFWEDGKRNTYYMVCVKLLNNRWTPVRNIKPEYVRE